MLVVGLDRAQSQLRPVHGDVSAAEEACRIGGVRRCDGDPDAHADAGAHDVEHERPHETCHESLGDRRSVVGVGVEEHDCELIAPESHEGVGRTQASREPGTELPQELVAGRVAEGVVDLLEVVEIEEQERELLPRQKWVGLVGEERLKDVEQIAAITQSRQLVCHGFPVTLLGEEPQPARREGQPDPDENERRSGKPYRGAAEVVERPVQENYQSRCRSDPGQQEAGRSLRCEGVGGAGP